MSFSRSGPLRVLVVDDQTLFRMGLVQLLDVDPRLEIVGQAEDGAEALDLCGHLQPDVVLLDLKMPRMNGVEATRRIVADFDAKVVVLTVLDTDPDVIAALKAGAMGYVLKDSKPAAIVSAIMAVDAGEQVLATRVVHQIVDLIGETKQTMPESWQEGLTRREAEILRMVANGTGNKEIARRLCISDKTVRNHLGHVYEKLGLSDRSQVVLYALRRGLAEV